MVTVGSFYYFFKISIFQTILPFSSLFDVMIRNYLGGLYHETVDVFILFSLLFAIVPIIQDVKITLLSFIIKIFLFSVSDFFAG